MINKKRITTINNLPYEIILNILEYLDIKSLKNLYNCNKKYKDIIYEEINIYFNNVSYCDYDNNIIFLKNDKYWLKNVFHEYDIKINEYIKIEDFKKSYKVISELLKYKDNFIYSKILNFHLVCYMCKTEDNFYNHFFYCINCSKKVCIDCTYLCDICGDVHCDNCDCSDISDIENEIE